MYTSMTPRHSTVQRMVKVKRKALDLAQRYPCSSDFEGLYTNIVHRPLGLDTDCVGPSIRFLDVEVTLRLGRFVWWLYDKRNEMNIFEGMRKFPHADTVLDSGVRSRALVNEIGRFDRRTSSSRGLRAAVLRHC